MVRRVTAPSTVTDRGARAGRLCSTDRLNRRARRGLSAVLKRIRIAILLYILLFVAAGHYLTAARSTAWERTLRVTVHAVNGDGSNAAGARAGSLQRGDFESIERFFTVEAARHGVSIQQPIRFDVASGTKVELPTLAKDLSMLDAVIFSLRLRWAATVAEWQSDLPSADITLFAVYHDGESKPMLERSVGLDKGMVVVANLFSARSAAGSNDVIVAHELLHTLGATDKYDPRSNMPRFPDGYADPDARPLLPQKEAELMAGRIAVTEHTAEVPRSLRDVVVGPTTAAEIGWRDAAVKP